MTEWVPGDPVYVRPQDPVLVLASVKSGSDRDDYPWHDAARWPVADDGSLWWLDRDPALGPTDEEES